MAAPRGPTSGRARRSSDLSAAYDAPMARDYDLRRIEVIDDATAEMFRRMTPEDRLRTAFEAMRFAEELSRAAVVQQHPDWRPAAIEQEVRRRTYGATG